MWIASLCLARWGDGFMMRCVDDGVLHSCSCSLMFDDVDDVEMMFDDPFMLIL